MKRRKNLTLEKKPYIGLRLDRDYNLLLWKLLLIKPFYSFLTDSHMFRENTFDNIELVREFNRRLFEANWNTLFNKYMDEYCEIRARIKLENATNGYEIFTVKNL